MRIICQQTILMIYHTFYFRKLREMSQNVSSRAVVIGIFRVKMQRVYDYNNLQGLIFYTWA